MMLENIAHKLACKLLDSNDHLKILPASAYDAIPQHELRLFCHFYARYGLPTKEMVEWLKKHIGKKSAIEIGAGHGDLGRALGIPMTDNYCQTWPDVKEFYEAAEQPVIAYGEDVERLDALEAAQKYKPDIIIGQWVTHWIDPALSVPVGGGSMYGVKEDLLLKECKTYIVLGNKNIHGHKPILKQKHAELKLPFIRSRASSPKENVVYVWGS